MIMKTLFPLIALFVLGSCSKSSPSSMKQDIEGPKITLLSPLGTPGYNVGEPVCFKANIIDETTLQTLTLSVRKNGTELPAYTQRFRPADKIYSIDTKVYPGIDCAGNSVLLFEAIDRLGNKSAVSLPLEIR